MAELPSLRQLLEAGVHFGHKTSRWHPKMKPYIFTSKNGVHVINLEKTEEKIKEAADFLKKEAETGKSFVFVGTKKQSGEIVKKAAQKAGVSYATTRWLGGTITNYEAIKGSVRKFKGQLDELAKEDSKMTKSELSRIRKEAERSEKFLGGLLGMDKKPDVLVLFGSHDEKNALKEAKVDGIKIVAVVDTNADPSLIDYPIPANDDATKSVDLIANTLADAILEGKAKSASVKIEEKNEK